MRRRRSRASWNRSASRRLEGRSVNIRPALAALAAVLALAACSQKDPAREAIDAAESALNAVYEDAEKYVPERYAEVKKELEAARAAFAEERYADAIAAVKDVPAHAEALAQEAAAEKERRIAEMNANWTRISTSLQDQFAGIGARLEELGKMRKLPEGMDKQLLEEAHAAGDLETAAGKAAAAEGMAQDLAARLGMQAR